MPIELFVTVGLMSSTTFTVFVQVEIHPFAAVIVNDKVNVSLQLEPAATVTVEELEFPTIVPFPAILHAYVAHTGAE